MDLGCCLSGWNPLGSHNRRAFGRAYYWPNLYLRGFGGNLDGNGFADQLLGLCGCFSGWV